MVDCKSSEVCILLFPIGSNLKFSPWDLQYNSRPWGSHHCWSWQPPAASPPVHWSQSLAWILSSCWEHCYVGDCSVGLYSCSVRSVNTTTTLQSSPSGHQPVVQQPAQPKPVCTAHFYDIMKCFSQDSSLLAPVTGLQRYVFLYLRSTTYYIVIRRTPMSHYIIILHLLDSLCVYKSIIGCFGKKKYFCFSFLLFYFWQCWHLIRSVVVGCHFLKYFNKFPQTFCQKPGNKQT